MERRNKYPICANCKNTFGFNYRDIYVPIVGNKRPLLLHCGHAVCEGCVTKKLKAEECFSVKCGVCSTISGESFDKKSDLKELFPLSTYAVGQVVLKRPSNPKAKDIKLGFFSQKTKMKTEMICDECSNKADCQCLKCEGQYCSSCFDKFHSMMKTLKNHVKSPLKTDENTIFCEAVVCQIHAGQLLEFHCKDCSVYCCKECVFIQHLKCSCSRISEMNEPYLPEFEKMYEEACTVLKQLYSTQKKVRQEGENAQNEEGSEVQRQVMMHFSKLHGLLQLQEASILEQIQKAQSQTTESLVTIGTELEEKIQEMENLLIQCKASMENENFKNTPVLNLLDKLKNVTEMPCYLGASDSISSSQIEFTVEEEIVNQLKNHCKLSLPEKIEFELYSKTNLPEDYEIEQIPDQLPEFINFVKNSDLKIQKIKPATQKVVSKPEIPLLPQAEVKTKKSANISMQELLRKNRQSLKGPFTRLSASPINIDTEALPTIIPLAEGMGEVVSICHLNSPSDFYIQRKAYQTVSERITQYLSKQSNIKKDPPTTVELGEMYIAQYVMDKKWYRCVATEFRPANMCAVTYIDYGNTETVHKSNLRELPEEFEKIPALTSHCKLFGCSPNGGQWTTEAIQRMVSMVQGAELYCSVERASPDLLEVRLRVLNSNKDGSKDSKNDDRGYEINQALIFLDMAHLVEDIKSLGGSYQDRRKVMTFSDIMIPKDKMFEATVSHIISPSEFFIQKRQHLQFLKDFDKMYSQLGPNDSLVYHPTHGMAVAVKSTVDGTWKRGVVIDTPKPLTVIVKFVDFGNEETVFWSNVRILDKLYVKTSTQAIKCKLSDVAPNFEKGWTKEATAIFQKLAPKNKVFKVYVDEVEDSCLKVVLYETHKDKEVIINGKLVRMGHARSVGSSSTMDEYPTGAYYKDERDSVYSAPPTLFTSKSSQSLTLSPQDELFRDVSAASVYESSVMSNKSQDLSSEPELSTCGSVRSLEDNLSNHNDPIKVQAVKIVSPSELYLTSEKLERNFEKLKADMTDFYSQCTGEQQSWKAGDVCAALRKEDATWYRGIVQEVFSDNCKVFLSDIAELEEVEIENVCILTEPFKKVPDITFKCFLTEIIPPGGSSTWPGSTNDMLKVLVTNHPDLYIQPEPIEDGVLPVKLYSKIEKVTGALEPAKVEHIDLSRQLRELGLALPRRMLSQNTAVSSAPNGVHSGHVLPSFDTQKPKVQEWLLFEFEAANAQCELDKEKACGNIDLLEDPRTMKRAPPKRDQKHKRPTYIPADQKNQINPEKIHPVLKITETQSRATEWLPAKPFKKLEFLCCPTNVDYNCCIYIQHIESRDTLKLLQQSLLACFETSHAKPQDLIWTKGQICISKYAVDGKWYRAKVMEVAVDYIKVLFVDYGNVEEVKPCDMRKEIVMQHIPIQCHQCQPVGIIPNSEDGKWPEKVLDLVHSLVVEQECRITLIPSQFDGGCYSIREIQLPSKENLFQTLISLNFANYVVDCETLALEQNQQDEIEALGFDSAYALGEDPNLLKEIKDTNAGEEFVTEPTYTLETPLLKGNDVANAVMDPAFYLEDTLKIETENNEEIITDSVLPLEETLFKVETNSENVAQKESLGFHSLPDSQFEWYELAEKEHKPLLSQPTPSLKQSSYKNLLIPDSIVEMLVEVGVVVSYNSVRIRIVECEDEEIMRLNNAFNELQEKIQAEAESLVPIIKPLVGLPCIGCYTEDSEWYRAEITQVFDDNHVKVRYVDYGNEEKISTTRLREIKLEYLTLPTQSVQVFLDKITKGPAYNAQTVNQMLINCFKANPYTMVFERKYPKLEVTFYNRQSGVKPWQQLLDYQLLAED